LHISSACRPGNPVTYARVVCAVAMDQVWPLYRVDHRTVGAALKAIAIRKYQSFSHNTPSILYFGGTGGISSWYGARIAM
jgi:hypothetical protein